MSVYDKLDLERYSRQLGLLGVEGQLRLAEATVAVVGLGGLGSVAALYLAAAGVGRLILVDRDNVEPSNLNRQILYVEADVGKPKAVVAAERLSKLNPRLDAVPVPEEVDEGLARWIAGEADVVVDALDNWEARLLLDEAAWLKGKPLVHGAVEALRGQATTVKRGVTGCLACIAPPAPRRGCTAILGPAAGVIGSIEALEAVKVLAGAGEPLYNKLLYLDLARGVSTHVIPLKPLPCEACRGRIERLWKGGVEGES